MESSSKKPGNKRSILCCTFVTITGQNYTKKRGKLRKDMLFYHDAHISHCCMATVQECGFELLQYQPYSLHLVQPDTHLSPNKKEALAGTNFDSNDDIVAAIQNFWDSPTKLGKSSSIVGKYISVEGIMLKNKSFMSLGQDMRLRNQTPYTIFNFHCVYLAGLFNRTIFIYNIFAMERQKFIDIFQLS